MEAIRNIEANDEYWSHSGLQNQTEKNHTLQLENLLSFMKEKVNKSDPKEKVTKQPVKEKAQMMPVKEKKIINRPTTQ